MSDIFDILDRIKPRLASPAPLPGQRQVARALVTESPTSTTITVPLGPDAVTRGKAAADRWLTHLSGRFVGADEPNSNGQMWTSDDLRFGLPTVTHGPLNWLHNERSIIGTITDAQLVEGRQGAAGEHAGTHIQASSVLWRYLFPDEARVVESAAAENRLFYSMECLSEQVQCASAHGGCGALMPYKDAVLRTEKACEHIRQRAAARRFVEPVFQGGAVIVPPKTPGWANAHLSVVRRAAAMLEADADFAAFTGGDETLAAQILTYTAE